MQNAWNESGEYRHFLQHTIYKVIMQALGARDGYESIFPDNSLMDSNIDKISDSQLEDMISSKEPVQGGLLAVVVNIEGDESIRNLPASIAENNFDSDSWRRRGVHRSYNTELQTEHQRKRFLNNMLLT